MVKSCRHINQMTRQKALYISVYSLVFICFIYSLFFICYMKDNALFQRKNGEDEQRHYDHYDQQESQVTSQYDHGNDISNDTQFEVYQAGGLSKRTGKDPSLWINHNCLEPLQKPIIGTHDLSRILNVGMPKCGSNSLQVFFEEDFKTKHFKSCGKGNSYCGYCIQNYVQKKMPPLANCGNYTVLTQMDRPGEDNCVFPQISYLKELYQEAPNATWILPFRNATGWIRSVNNWSNLRYRFAMSCDFSKYGINKGDLKKINDKDDKNMVSLLCNHVKHIRKFVYYHPSLTLIEFSIEDPNAGNILATYFPVNASRWGKMNVNEKQSLGRG